MQIFQRQRQVLRKSPVVLDDSQHGAARAMRLQPPFTKRAKRAVAIRRTRHVDVAGHARTEPFQFFLCGHAAYGRHFAHKFMPRNATKRMVAAKNLHIGIADSRKPHAHQRPAWPQPRPRFFLRDKFMVSNGECQHERDRANGARRRELQRAASAVPGKRCANPQSRDGLRRAQ